MDNSLKVGDWLLVDDEGYLCMVDEIVQDNPLIIDLRLYVDHDYDNFAFQSIRPEQHKIVRITKEVADIMIGCLNDVH